MRVLERFAFVEVPESEAERVIERTRGTEVRGHALASSAPRPDPSSRQIRVSGAATGRDFGRGSLL